MRTNLSSTIAALGLASVLSFGSAHAQEFLSAAAALRPAPAFTGSTASAGIGSAGTQEFLSAAAALRPAPAFTGSTTSSGVAYAGTQEFLAAAAATRPGLPVPAFDHTPDTRYAQMPRVPSHPAPNARLMARTLPHAASQASAPVGAGPNG